MNARLTISLHPYVWTKRDQILSLKAFVNRYRAGDSGASKASFDMSKSDFEKSLSTTSAIVDWIPLDDDETMSCATKSQMIRDHQYYKTIFAIVSVTRCLEILLNIWPFTTK